MRVQMSPYGERNAVGKERADYDEIRVHGVRVWCTY